MLCNYLDWFVLNRKHAIFAQPFKQYSNLSRKHQANMHFMMDCSGQLTEDVKLC